MCDRDRVSNIRLPQVKGVVQISAYMGDNYKGLNIRFPKVKSVVKISVFLCDRYRALAGSIDRDGRCKGRKFTT